jgi:putative Holliday junction resolvase
MGAIKRILGLDIGDRRIGVAVTDEIGVTAQPVGTIDRSKTSAYLKEIIEIAKQYDAACIVAGLPKRLDGSSSPQTDKVERFLTELKAQTDIPIQTWDERLTTATAEAALIEANVRRKPRRKVIDSLAAQIMLQHYLDCNRPQRTDDDENRTEMENVSQ